MCMFNKYEPPKCPGSSRCSSQKQSFKSYAGVTPSSGQIAHPEQVWPKYTSISIQLPPEVHLYITLETCHFSGLECSFHARCIISRSLQVIDIDWWLRFHLFHLFIEENRLWDPERGEKKKGKAETKALNVAEKWKNGEFLIGVRLC